MHLIELTERSSAIIMVQRVRKNGFPFFNRFRRGKLHDRLAVTFQAYGQLGRITVRPATAISALSTMHEDIFHVAEDKRVTIIILPFHIQRRKDEGDDAVENVGHGWRGVNQRVLENAPCSVALLVDRGSQQTDGSTANVAQRVCIVFFGGPDDREALELGGRMAEHPAVKELDEMAMTEFRKRWDHGKVEYIERVEINIKEGVLAIGRSEEYEVIIVGKCRFPSTSMVAELADRQAEHAELGPIGDLLASPSHGIVSSVLVIQQHDLTHAEEAPVSKIMQTEDDTIIAHG
ncbi:hypothetical protein F0562_016348 [Nyssa sinensis]|uniref:Cation/H+ exchanger domain-containing protein n=1 Tax=Nyssa sinensis TaxID=561372 RepID=A0A5J4ZMJ2_9ASTE|nr:hypothetical protein F0562_016348 [Nyssa sinensis]